MRKEKVLHLSLKASQTSSFIKCRLQYRSFFYQKEILVSTESSHFSQRNLCSAFKGKKKKETIKL